MSVLQPLARCRSKTSFDDDQNMSGSGAGDGVQQMPSDHDEVNQVTSSRVDEAQRQ